MIKSNIYRCVTRNSKIVRFSIGLVFVFNSCEKIIEKPVDEYHTLETEEAVIDCLKGAYGQLAKAMSMYNYFSIKSDDINLRRCSEVGVLKLNPGISLTDEFFIYNFWYNGKLLYVDLNYKGEWIYEYTYTWPYYKDLTNEFYRSTYRVILMTNKLIYYLSVKDKKEKWEEYLGEAYFLRAYMYFKLARIFGRVPLVLDLKVNYDLDLAEFEEIYNQIEKDLESASIHLPTQKSVSRKGAQTPHKGTAQTLLAEVYLTMGGYPLNDNTKYLKAAETAKEVIENADIYEFGLMDDFANLWQWDYHDNMESIWRIYYQGESFNPDAIGTLSSPVNKVITEVSYFNEFPDNYRKELTFWHYYFDEIYAGENILSDRDSKPILIFKDAGNKDIYTFSSSVIGKKQVVNFSCYPEDIIKTTYPPHRIIHERPKFAATNKYLQRFENTSISFETIENIYDTIENYIDNFENNPEFDPRYTQFFHLFRYAHTLLTYAEASARAGNIDALTYEALNMVRRRSYNLPIYEPSVYDIQPGISPTAFADSVVKERGWEFCHEFEGRWNDIIRLQLYPQVEANRNIDILSGSVDAVYNGQTYFIPLPQEDVWLNPKLENNNN